MVNIVWFKSDLRVHDNPALFHACQNPAIPTIAVFPFVEEQWRIHGVSPAKQSLIIRQLISLREQLSRLNLALYVVEAPRFSDVPNVLLSIASEFPECTLYWNKELELNEKECEQQVNALSAEHDLACNAYDDTCLIEPGTIRNSSGSSFKVYSAFKRAFVAAFNQRVRPLYGAPGIKNTSLFLPSKEKLDAIVLSDQVLLEKEQQLGLWSYCLDSHEQHPQEPCDKNHESIAELWPAGENEAFKRLDAFLENCADDYKEFRDFPARDNTSTLSPYLAIGAISSRQCIHDLMVRNQGMLVSGQEGMDTWANELIWREFYRHLLHDYAELCKYRAFKTDTERLPWRHDEELFKAWCEGKTGYPIVDAGMRQLNQTAWMHNRVRMICAMFLTKHLFIDWRWGEAYFMTKLVDGDLASNNGGWQWSASTGVDAVPYFRIFNPVRQSERFDSDGDYIKRYVPELRSLDRKSIHMPTAGQALSVGYVLPLVDHKEATTQTKQHFSALSESVSNEVVNKGKNHPDPKTFPFETTSNYSARSVRTILSRTGLSRTSLSRTSFSRETTVTANSASTTKDRQLGLNLGLNMEHKG